jgi:O-methyltransferase involved in polyketide biosynthesis
MTAERRPVPVALSGVPETMLWTLYNRASEAERSASILKDPDAIRILKSIDYDYARSFGAVDLSHAVRSRVFDDVLKPWLAEHPEGVVIELGCGLETQFQRCDNGLVRWICVDVPDAIAVRERFLPESDHCRYVRKSALDTSWMQDIEHLLGKEAARARSVFITAQGLFMYFQEAEVKALVRAIAAHYPEAELMFDAIPHWFSRKTIRGCQKTPHYRVPPMSWSINRNEIGQLRDWSRHITAVALVPWHYFPGVKWRLLRMAMRLPGLRNAGPSVVRMRTRKSLDNGC